MSVLNKMVSCRSLHQVRIQDPSSPILFYRLVSRIFVFFLVLDAVLSKQSQRENELEVTDGSRWKYYDKSRFIDNLEANGRTRATKAAESGDLQTLIDLNQTDPSFLFQVDERGRIPVVAAIARGSVSRISVINVLFHLNPALLSQKDPEGMSAKDWAVQKDDIDALMTIYHLNRTLLYERDGRGRPLVMSLSDRGNHKALYTFYNLDKDLFRECNDIGYSLMTNAVYDGRISLLAMLLRWDPDFAVLVDKNGKSALSAATRSGKDDFVNLIYSFNPNLILQKNKDEFPEDTNLWEPLLNKYIHWVNSLSPVLILAALYAIYDILQERRPTPTSINVHQGTREIKTFEALNTLKNHIGELNSDYYRDIFLQDFGIKELELTVQTLEELSSNLEEYRNQSCYLYYKLQERRNWEEVRIKEIHHENTQSLLFFKKIPEKGYPREEDIRAITVEKNGRIVDENKDDIITSVVLFAKNSHVSTALSEVFNMDAQFRYGLGFATITGNPLYYPVLFQNGFLSWYGKSVPGKDFLTYAHAFSKYSTDSRELLQRQSAFINGVKNGVTELASDPNKFYRLCEPGQIQYLLTTLLQGRLPGVMIDDTTLEGLRNIVPSANVLVMECCLNAQKQGADNQEAFMNFVKNDYSRNNPFLSGSEYPDLKKKFWSEIDTYASFLDPA